LADEACEGRDFGAWDAEAVADEVVERQFQFHAGFGEAQHDVAGFRGLLVPMTVAEVLAV
jgi:hypothetical protein